MGTGKISTYPHRTVIGRKFKTSPYVDYPVVKPVLYLQNDESSIRRQKIVSILKDMRLYIDAPMKHQILPGTLSMQLDPDLPYTTISEAYLDVLRKDGFIVMECDRYVPRIHTENGIS